MVIRYAPGERFRGIKVVLLLNWRGGDGMGSGKENLQNIAFHAYPDASDRATLYISSPCRRIRNTRLCGSACDS